MTFRASVVALVLSIGTPALGQIDGAVQIGLGTSLVSSTSVSLEGELDTLLDTPVEYESETTRYGLNGDSGVSLFAGYGITEQFILGGFAEFGSSTTENDSSAGDVTTSSETETSGFSIGPRFEFSILEDGSLRPYLLASLAYASVSQESDNTTLDLSGGQIAGAVGLHWFLAPGFSIDPALYAGYASVGGELDLDTLGETELEGSLTSFGVSLSVSGWAK